ncbi:aromatic acid exporter family protein [Alicyclobacillus sp. SO9]|uniref:aromatic acid exporter family protein n=1 Tax=Alicyclobacillus sp. SO9 TaxID=2665646 RepID=UPI0018E8AB95|nr:aromatic acid exporter family protein [Alicyclobacillus sp. SO9]QQE77436.1 hypothetical protein GI364_15965 [Alicyclobacillus sp. SO9]
MLVGARIIKTGIAVIFAIYISQWFHLTTGIGYIVASSVLAIQPSVYKSWRLLLENTEANVIGGIIAIGGIHLFGSHPAVIGLIIILVIAINLRLKLERSLDLSIFVVIALAYSSQDHYLTYALHRFVFIMIGISFATLINLFVLPPRQGKRVFSRIYSLSTQLSLLLRLGSTQEIAALRLSRVQVERELERIEELFRLYLEERPLWHLRTPMSLRRRQVVARQMIQTLSAEVRILKVFETLRQPYPEFSNHVTHVLSYEEKIRKKSEGMIQLTSDTPATALYKENDEWIVQDVNHRLKFAVWLVRDLILQLQLLETLVKKQGT